jgi:hypothetical protein
MHGVLDLWRGTVHRLWLHDCALVPGGYTIAALDATVYATELWADSLNDRCVISLNVSEHRVWQHDSPWVCLVTNTRQNDGIVLMHDIHDMAVRVTQLTFATAVQELNEVINLLGAELY